MRLFGTLTGTITRFDRAAWLSGIFDGAFALAVAQWLVIDTARATNLTVTPARGANLTVTSTLRNTGD